jgi:hypothetical protein
MFAVVYGSSVIDFDVQSHQRYSLRGWNKSGFNYLIISGLSEAEMVKLEDLLRAQADSSGTLNDVGLYGISEYRLCVLIICRRAQKSEMELLSRLPQAMHARRRPDINHTQKKVNT